MLSGEALGLLNGSLTVHQAKTRLVGGMVDANGPVQAKFINDDGVDLNPADGDTLLVAFGSFMPPAPTATGSSSSDWVAIPPEQLACLKAEIKAEVLAEVKAMLRGAF